MPLDKAALATALEAAFQAGMDDPDWTLAQAAGAMADAIDLYVRAADVTGITTDVTDLAANLIGHGTQSGTGVLL